MKIIAEGMLGILACVCGGLIIAPTKFLISIGTPVDRVWLARIFYGFCAAACIAVLARKAVKA